MSVAVWHFLHWRRATSRVPRVTFAQVNHRTGGAGSRLLSTVIYHAVEHQHPSSIVLSLLTRMSYSLGAAHHGGPLVILRFSSSPRPLELRLRDQIPKLILMPLGPLLAIEILLHHASTGSAPHRCQSPLTPLPHVQIPHQLFPRSGPDRIAVCIPDAHPFGVPSFEEGFGPGVAEAEFVEFLAERKEGEEGVVEFGKGLRRGCIM